MRFPYLLSSIVLTAEITETSAVARPPQEHQTPLAWTETMRRREYIITEIILVNSGSFWGVRRSLYLCRKETTLFKDTRTTWSVKPSVTGLLMALECRWMREENATSRFFLTRDTPAERCRLERLLMRCESILKNRQVSMWQFRQYLWESWKSLDVSSQIRLCIMQFLAPLAPTMFSILWAIKNSSKKTSQTKQSNFCTYYVQARTFRTPFL